MTLNQKRRFYFPHWQAAVRANGWRMAARRLVIPDELRSEEIRYVLHHGRARAAALHRGCTLDDLRHGAHLFALGRDYSSADLNNKQTDRVVTLFKLLANPDDLAARLAWDAYQRGEDPGQQKRTAHFIRHAAPEAYAGQIAADRFGTRNLDQLTPGQQTSLAMTLANRTAAARQPIMVTTEGDPF